MPNPHIVIDTNEIRMTDDDGAPSLHILRPSVLADETYYWFPQCYAPTSATLINTATPTSVGMSCTLTGGCRYNISGIIVMQKTGAGGPSPYLKISTPSEENDVGYIQVHQPRAAQWGGTDINYEYAGTNIGNALQYLFFQGHVFLRSTGTLTVQVRIASSDVSSSYFMKVQSSSSLIVQRMA